MTHVFHRHTKMTPVIAAMGEGVYITDDNGKRYLDASGGAAVSCLGHSHPVVLQAIRNQIDRISFAHTGFFTSQVAEDLAEKLTSKAPGDLNYVYFVSGGSEAVEAALKLARQYYLETGRPERRHIITRRQSYHGNTLGALAAGGNMWRREPFDPLLVETHNIAPCFSYRERRAGESEETYGLRVADELEEKIKELGEESVIAFIAEPVVGATAGAVTASPGYFKRIREICDKYDVLLILDEVMCGMGRTGSLYACEPEDIAPDLLTCAKGLGAGYQPIGATLLSQKIFEAVRDGSGFFQHGHTYMGHPVACAAALAVQTVIEDEGLLERVTDMGERLNDSLQVRFGNHHHVGDIRGRGLFQAMEFVADRSSKKPFDPALKLNAKIKQEAMKRGLICYPMGGTIDGVLGDHVLLAPPFIIEGVHIKELVEKLGDSIDSVLASV
ncbi:MAG: putative aminotransferase [Alphaproteobacteria bacterium MarineAlpha4_Bin2]|nr:MAG: putative aminotransferase [Alphaproteobacteria bacterium MarineAlpha4_Bin2]